MFGDTILIAEGHLVSSRVTALPGRLICHSDTDSSGEESKAPFLDSAQPLRVTWLAASTT